MNTEKLKNRFRKYVENYDISVHNKLICKVIRDADKLDIFYLLGAEKDLMNQDTNQISEKNKRRLL